MHADRMSDKLSLAARSYVSEPDALAKDWIAQARMQTSIWAWSVSEGVSSLTLQARMQTSCKSLGTRLTAAAS